MTLINKAIHKTLVYADIFDYPLTRSELHRFLISTKPTKLSNLPNKPYFYLSSRNYLVTLRRSRHHFSQLKYQKLNRHLWLFKLIPWIKLVAVSGALAMNNSTATDDIDLLVVTSKNRLWLTRALIYFFPSRRRFNQSESNSFCFNLWLDSSSLALPKLSRNLYTAHELAQLKPILNKNQTYQKLINANLWLKTFLPNWTI